MSVIAKVTEVVAKVLPDRPPDALRDAHRLIGREVDRIDGRVKVTGAARFAAEYPLPGLVYASLVYSRIAKGRITAIDSAAAAALPGVLAVITHLNAPKLKDPPLFDPASGTGAAGSRANLLNTDEIFWNGQPVAIVVADSTERADAAAAQVVVSYSAEPASTSFALGLVDARLPKSVMNEPAEIMQGDAEAALAAAVARVDHEYDTPRYNHNAIELHATTAEWQDGRLTVHDASQFVRGFADSLGEMFSLKKADVRVLAPFVGGGFGGKGSMWGHVPLCALAAKVVQRPVKLELSREGVFRCVGGRTPSRQRVALAADAQGRLTALIHTGTTATSTTNDFAEQFSFPARHLYATKTLLIRQKVMHLNTTANTFMRAPGESIGTFALESAMDELAYALNLDPVQLRALNDAQRDPAKDTEFSSRHFREALALGAEKFGWSRRPAQVGAQRDGKWLIGQGMATAFYPAYRFPAAASIRLERDGSVVVRSAAHEMGMGTATVQSQHAAERLGLSMAQVRFEYGDTALPDAPVAGGSNQTVSVALAVQLACEKLQHELLALAQQDPSSPLAQARFEDIQSVAGGLYRKDRPELGETYVALLARHGRDHLEVMAKSGMPLESMKYSMGSYGAQFCELRVNQDSGEVRIARWVGAFDTGRILNPKTARSQFMGGITMGIGMALTEESLFDERAGRLVNPSLAEYHVPVNADVPDIETYFLDIPDPHTPLGAHGIGEIGITGAAAAVANAVYHATGRRVRSLPITLDKLL